ncbi:hypothetical protein LSTR_LSTR001439 [Laodelphax striatellus]|uniref:Annexin n=1 Tax=Laodelphax striatellus TaxID=195883 RepID=A0A482XA05_LAOST|nr:hypothetical protein LSTR_LSTR001439 [Laodelphax striatellus]
MWRIYFLFQLFCFLSGHADCETKPHPLGEPVSVLGPTIIEKSKNKPEDDADVIKKAIDGKVYAPIAQLIGERTLAQRLAINIAYGKLAKENISDSINNALFNSKHDGSERRFYNGFFLQLPVYLANCFYDSMNNWIDWVHLSIVCTSSVTRLTALRKGYLDAFGVEITKDIDKFDAGKDVLNVMLDPKTMRPDSGTDDKLLDSQVALIPDSTDKCNSNDLLNFMASTSFDQIRNVSNKWIAKNKNADIVDNFRENCERGYRQEAYKRIVRFARDPYQYFSEEFKLGYELDSRNSRAHEYLVISRSEIDLKDIIKRYNDQYSADIIKEVKGNADKNAYQALLAAVLVGNAG